MTRRSAGEGLIRQRTNGTWEARYAAADGARRSLYRRTKREATDALREALGQAQTGIRPVDRQLSTSDYLDAWIGTLCSPPADGRELPRHRRPLPQAGHRPRATGEAPARAHPRHAARPGAAREAAITHHEALCLRRPPYRARPCPQARSRPAQRGDAHRPAARRAAPAADRRAGPLLLASVAVTGSRPSTGSPSCQGCARASCSPCAGGTSTSRARTLTVSHTLQQGTRTLAEPKTDRSRRTIVARRRHPEDAARAPAWSSSRNGSQPASDGREGLVFASTVGTAIPGPAEHPAPGRLYGHLTPATTRRSADRMREILAG